MTQDCCGTFAWMLNLRIVRGPLQGAEEGSILREFNRLTNSAIAESEFRRWVRSSPDGPAWHAVLETDESRIAGHFCLIPLRARYRGKQICAARTEYFFVHEDFRREKVRGIENSFLPCGLLLLEHLYRHCSEQGWGPLIVSASEQIQPFHEIVGCRPADFGLTECLLILRPWDAARRTPNLTAKQRMGLLLVGLAQQVLWSIPGIIPLKSRGVKCASVASVCVHPRTDRTAFFEDMDSLCWRYPDAEYITIVSEDDPHQYVIAKHGSNERYLRVCQWHLEESGNPVPFIAALIDRARQEKALGIRWSLYGDQQRSVILNAMRKLGFLRAPRNRRLLFYTSEDAFLNPEQWDIADSFFSFDL
jgi:hypothetical protein